MMAFGSIQRTYRTHRKAIVTATSGILYGGGWSLGFLAGFGEVGAAILVLAAIIGGYDIARAAYHEVTNRSLGIKTLVTLAAIGAIFIGEYWEAAAVVFLFSLGSYLEGRTMRKTRSALEELLELTPDTATVRRDGRQTEVPANEVESGEVVIVRPGEKIPVDGDIVQGESVVNQAPVTGESAPVHKSIDDEVYAGTVNQEGAIDVRTTGAGTDTTIERIIRRVEKAQEAQSPTERFIDRFARYYTPGVLALAIGAYAITGNAILSLTLLVIGCPGALVIGPPVSIVSAIGNAARSGVLMKGGEHLETAGKIDRIAFDKTGTLTAGETVVAEVQGFGVEDRKALELAAIAETKSEHHLGDAIVDAARQQSIPVTDGGSSVLPETERRDERDALPRSIPDPENFEVIVGKGVRARYSGLEIVVGNRTLLDDFGIDVPSDVEDYVRTREELGETAVHVVRRDAKVDQIDEPPTDVQDRPAVDNGSVVGVISMRDELRNAAPQVVETLEDSGIETVMLTGDNERTARAVADEVGIDEYRAELLPVDKQRAIEDMQADNHVVAMVGDGINDAPSLATADVGIAMGAAGTDTAIETADMALMADDLERIPYAVGLSKTTRWNVIENVGLAVATVTVLLAGVLTSYVTLASGMLIHEASVLAVILNGMRLLRY